MDEKAANEFVDQFGLLWNRLSGTNRTMGRVLGWLMICDPAEQSAPDLVEALKVSKGSVSTAVRKLETARLVEQVHVPGNRRIHYRIPALGWAAITRGRVQEMDMMIAVGAIGQKALRGASAEKRERVDNYVEWLTWWRRKYDELMVEWAKDHET